MPPGTIVASGSLVSPGGQQGIPGPQSTGPTGSVMDFAGSTAPSGWLLCDGTSYPTATYPALFGVIGYTYGGSGANFNVPDCRGRASVGAGQGTGLTNRALAATGGEENHQLVIAELASHTHIQDPHAHNIYSYAGAPAGGTYHVMEGGLLSGYIDQAVATNQNTGSDTAHNTMMPFIALNKIIKT